MDSTSLLFRLGLQRFRLGRFPSNFGEGSVWRRCTSRTHASITDSILGANGFSLRILGHCELHFTIITLPFLSNRVRNSITQRRKCHVTRCSCWPCHAHSSTITTTFLPSPTRPVNARCSHSPCGCWTHPRRAARVHMKLVLCWSPHMTGSSCQQMASWHCWTHAASTARCFWNLDTQCGHVAASWWEGGNMRGDPCSGRPTRCAEYGCGSQCYHNHILCLSSYSTRRAN